MGIDLVVFGLAPVNGFHIQGMAQDKRDILFIAEVGYPVPGEDTLHGDDNILSERIDSLQKDVGSRLDVPVQDNLSLLIENAEIHRPGVKVDSAVKFVLISVKSHVRPPLREFWVPESYLFPVWFRGALMSIKSIHRTDR